MSYAYELIRGELWRRQGLYWKRCEFALYCRQEPHEPPALLCQRLNQRLNHANSLQDVRDVRDVNPWKYEFELFFRDQRMLLRARTKHEYDEWLKKLQAWKAAASPLTSPAAGAEHAAALKLHHALKPRSLLARRPRSVSLGGGGAERRTDVLRPIGDLAAAEGGARRDETLPPTTEQASLARSPPADRPFGCSVTLGRLPLSPLEAEKGSGGGEAAGGRSSPRGVARRSGELPPPYEECYYAWI
mmetsp:Transcript_38145/g.89287  ORF Transcript_38145/g.89287 Transcript_38145/m.89287 type:complete len:245 (-) Transcript_38145:942-1676(-)|eukprot:CAMPEP_0119374496 /NCGR_PEP_ID=MMETSP1334-20130426/30632_1 /TAXON_ID=127549 /ORGANISM="Calcidiscus leptoporus, Strain RCC1130" /LENGTH=244 /DNA_ID=CAMNT_0007392569 /DNA_START=170 /DNA_END=904 /DNA_ORIENTATION=+